MPASCEIRPDYRAGDDAAFATGVKDDSQSTGCAEGLLHSNVRQTPRKVAQREYALGETRPVPEIRIMTRGPIL